MPLSALRPMEPKPDRAAALIRTEALSVTLGRGTGRQEILHDIDLAVPEGAFVCLIGPSGCGKSTLLKALGGLVLPSAGRVTVAGLEPAEAARRRMIGLVFQDANLLPWKNALDNVALLRGIADKSLSRAELRERAQAMLDLVELGDAARRRPHELSGGMRQRVAIARALALDPAVLLMDEPFGALDAITRDAMSRSLLDIWQRTGKTIILVTHSIEEAVYLASEVHVMGIRPGRIIETLHVPLPYPRGDAVLDSAEFGQAERRLRALLRLSHQPGDGR
ncbi:MAG TPA: ABC transporter ATP-binding protein [Lichenihabitans sp.]|nr:ABC transporter ATP-binding protein [Lichenihabitans sp.]